MPNFSDFKRNMSALVQNLLESQPNRVLVVAQDVIAQVNARRNERGMDADGGMYSPYTPAYADTRKAKGRQTAIKDFNDTGALNRSIYPRITDKRFAVVEVTVEPRGSDNQIKVVGAYGTEKRRRSASDRAANILAPSKAEEQAAGATIFDEIATLIRKTT